MSLSERVWRTIRRAVTVKPEELDLTVIVHGRPLSEVISVLGIPATTIVDLSRTEVFGKTLPPIRLHERGPLKTLHDLVGVEVTVRYYLVGGIPVYFVEEPAVTENVRYLYYHMKMKATQRGIAGPRDVVKMFEDFFDMIGLDPETALADPEVKATIYYVYRDMVGYGPIDALMNNPFLEEISWYGFDYPVMVVDKKIEEVFPNANFIPTNIMIEPGTPIHKAKFIMSQIVKYVTSKARVGLTTAKPIAEARLPDPTGRAFHRLASHLDVVSRSHGFTIRKFPERMYAITELIRFGTVSPLLAAYLILQLLERGYVLIVGPMASGKTTLLNALISSFPANLKVITIEDTPELSTPTINWHPLYTRRAPRESELEDIDFSRLVIHALRHRGYIVTLGEARGREMMDLIQAAASGHSAVATFHASSPEDALLRFVSPPIEAPAEALRLVTAMVYIAKTVTYAYGEPMSVRRVVKVYEITRVKGMDVDWVEVFKWNPMTDRFDPEMTIRGLAELWRRSPFLRRIGFSTYVDEAPRILVKVYVIARFFKKMVEEKVFNARELLFRFTSLVLKLEHLVQDVWPRLKPALEAYGVA